MKKVLVTGSGGQLGKCIQKIAQEYPSVAFEFTSSTELDITKNSSLTNIFRSNSFDYCINCAAYTNVDQAEKSPDLAFAINAEGIKNLALACKEKEVVLIHISTDYVFDGEKKGPYKIGDMPNPINEYGKSKLLGEQFVQKILDNHFIIRTSWLYSEFGKNFYTTILKKAKTQNVLYVTDKQTGCPTNAINLANYLLQLIEQNKKNYGIHHFTDGKAMTWFQFAKNILRKNHMEDQVTVVKDGNYRSFAARPVNSVLI